MAGYTRQDTVDAISNGNVIDAVPLDAEFDALQTAFSAVGGHNHDGSAGSGAPITVVGPAQDVVFSGNSIAPKTDNTVDLGTSSLEFRDLYLDGTANIDALVADTADINGGTIDSTAIGGTTPSTGAFTALTATSATIGGDTAITATASQTLTNKTFNLANNTLVATSAELAAAITDETGTGSVVFSDSPALSGTPTSPTATVGTNTTQIATTAFVVGERDATATLTNKTLTTPTINGGTVSGITDLAVADGGTGASTAADARTNLGLGTISTQNANSVTITGGSISGVTDIAIADGGTGASNAAGARTNLGLGTIATQNSNDVAITGGTLSGIVLTSPTINGSVTGTALTSSATDTTPGKLLQVGDGGLLALAPNVSDVNALDNIFVNMRVRILTANVSTVNGPSGAGGGVCDTYAFGGANIFQIYHEITDSGAADFRSYTRGFAGGVWSTWVQIYTSNMIVGTVSQSGGTPTGAVVERGGTGLNGYVRMADGTQICHGRLNLEINKSHPTSIDVQVGSTGLYRSPSALTWDFPASFEGTRDISITANFRRASIIISGVHIVTFTTTSVSFVPWASFPYALADAKEVFITATGRWF